MTSQYMTRNKDGFNWQLFEEREDAHDRTECDLCATREELDDTRDMLRDATWKLDAAERKVGDLERQRDSKYSDTEPSSLDSNQDA